MKALIISGSRARMPDPVYPLGAAIVATALRRAGHEILWFDALRHQAPEVALAELIDRERPRLVAMSLRNIDNAAFPNTNRHFEEHLGLARVVREHIAAPLVLGGSAFSLVPEAFLTYLDADYGVIGEGERALPELAAMLERGEQPARIFSAERLTPPFLQPERDLFDAAWYDREGGQANMQTKRGCPLGCVYCTYPLLEGASMRCIEPGLVVDEMQQLKAAGITNIFIVDAVFNRPESHAAAICDEILRRGLEISFTGYFVPQGKLPELPGLLSRAGCAAVELGTDALSDPVLERLCKGFSVDDVIAFSQRLNQAGIKQCHNLIFGCPGETPETFAESVRRMDEIDPTAVIATVGLRAYPGTPLWLMSDGWEVDPADPTTVLEPVFYVEEDMAKGLVEKVGSVAEARRGWIFPGLGTRYNQRHLSRLRQRHKGPLWRLL